MKMEVEIEEASYFYELMISNLTMLHQGVMQLEHEVGISDCVVSQGLYFVILNMRSFATKVEVKKNA